MPKSPSAGYVCQFLQYSSQLRKKGADVSFMTQVRTYRQSERCRYTKVCYLADALRCFGFKTDCVLYMKCNGESCPEDRFHEAVDKLIDKTKAKHEHFVV